MNKKVKKEPVIVNPKKFKTSLDNNGRVCTKCSEYKTWDNYFVAAKTKTGYQSECKKCKHEKRRPTRDTKKEQYCAKKHKAKLKKEKPLLVKARELRSRLLSRSKDPVIKATTPPVDVLEQWLTRDKYICYYSDEEIEFNKITVDHKTPVSRGGTNCLENLCIASHHMNTAKGGLNEQEFVSLLTLIRTWEDQGESLLRRMKQGWF